jgi:hypothetical protein
MRLEALVVERAKLQARLSAMAPLIRDARRDAQAEARAMGSADRVRKHIVKRPTPGGARSDGKRLSAKVGGATRGFALPLRLRRQSGNGCMDGLARAWKGGTLTCGRCRRWANGFAGGRRHTYAAGCLRNGAPESTRGPKRHG